MSEREWEKVSPPLEVCVFTWNVLADMCADDSPQGFPYVPEDALDTALRRPMQIKEILADDADVIALQEVDNPNDFEEALKENGYTVLYNRRQDSELGVLVAFKKDKYELKARTMITFTYGGQVATFILLKDKATAKHFVFAATHLKAKDDIESTKVRERQVTELKRYVDNMVTSQMELNDGKMESPHAIVAGDLNADPSSRTMARLTREWNQFNSVYMAKTKTTFKVRHRADATPVAKCCKEDYIIHNGITASRRELPQDFEHPFLPSKDFASDHLSLCAKLVFPK
jgi:mRNA deadenylase 3'-5' endonuclease subunit Ccr4